MSQVEECYEAEGGSPRKDDDDDVNNCAWESPPSSRVGTAASGKQGKQESTLASSPENPTRHSSLGSPESAVGSGAISHRDQGQGSGLEIEGGRLSRMDQVEVDEEDAGGNSARVRAKMSAEDEMLAKSASQGWGIMLNFGENVREAVQEMVSVERYEAGTMVLSEGLSMRRSLLVISGSLTIKMPVGDAEASEYVRTPYRLVCVGAGESLGEMTWPGQDPSRASFTTAAEDTICLCLYHQDAWSVANKAREEDKVKDKLSAVRSLFKKSGGGDQDAVMGPSSSLRKQRREEEEARAAMRVSQIMQVRSYREGEEVCRQGDPVSCVYLVLSGHCSLATDFDLIEEFAGSSQISRAGQQRQQAGAAVGMQGLHHDNNNRNNDNDNDNDNYSGNDNVHAKQEGVVRVDGAKAKGRGRLQSDRAKRSTSGARATRAPAASDKGEAITALGQGITAPTAYATGIKKNSMAQYADQDSLAPTHMASGHGSIPTRIQSMAGQRAGDSPPDFRYGTEKIEREAETEEQMLLLASSSRESRKRTMVHRVMLGELGVGDWIGELHVWGGVSVWRSSLIACPGGAEVCSLSASAFTEIPNCLAVRLFEAAQHKYRKRQAMLDHGVADSHVRGFVLQRPSLEQHVVPHFASKLGPRHVTSKLFAMVDRMVASRVEKIPSKCKCVVDARQALRTAMGFPEAPTKEQQWTIELYQISSQRTAVTSSFVKSSKVEDATAMSDSSEDQQTVALPPAQLEAMSRLWSCKSLAGLPRFRPSTSYMQIPPRVGSAMTPRGLVLSASERASVAGFGARNASSSTRPFRYLTVDSSAWRGPHETRPGTSQTSTSLTHLSSQIKQLKQHLSMASNVSPPQAASAYQRQAGRRLSMNPSGSQTERVASKTSKPHVPSPPKARGLVPLAPSPRAPLPPTGRSIGSHRWGDASPRVKAHSQFRTHVIPTM